MVIREYSLVIENRKVLINALKKYYESIKGESLISKIEKTKIGIFILEYIKDIKHIEEPNERRALNRYTSHINSKDTFYEVFINNETVAIFVVQDSLGNMVEQNKYKQYESTLHMPFILFTKRLDEESEIEILNNVYTFLKEKAIQKEKEYYSVEIEVPKKTVFSPYVREVLVDKACNK